MPDFNAIWDNLIKNIEDLAKLTVSNYANEAKKDAEDFITGIRSDLERWTKLLAAGELSTKDIEWLIQSKEDLLEMKLLKQKGLAHIRIDQFKNSVLNLVIDTVFKAVL